jgi:general stress protein 26
MKRKAARQFAISLMETTPAVYLATVDAQGHPQIRAVNNLRDHNRYPALEPFFRQVENPFTTYLTTFSTSAKSKQIRQNSRVALYFCRPESFHGVMLSGSMSVVSDKTVRDALWLDQWLCFWPKGPRDSKYRVFRFDPDGARGWSGEEMFSFTI